MTSLTQRMTLPPGVTVMFADAEADCPRPDKIGRYPDRHAAEQAQAARVARRVKGWREVLVPYECECGVWHLGHPSPRRQPAPPDQAREHTRELRAARNEVHQLAQMLAAATKRAERAYVHGRAQERETSENRSAARDLALAISRHRSRTRKSRPQDRELWEALVSVLVSYHGAPTPVGELVDAVWHRPETSDGGR
jgi:hypothetical protein